MADLGKAIRRVVPRWSSVSISSSPPSASIAFFHGAHAEATAGDVGDRRRGRDSVQEERAAPLDLGGRGQPELRGLSREARPVDPATVVGDLDHEAVATEVGAERDGRARGLTLGNALGRGLEAVIDGVPDHVNERVPEAPPVLRIHAEAAAVDLHVDLLLEAAGDAPGLLGEVLQPTLGRLELERVGHLEQRLARRSLANALLELRVLARVDLEDGVPRSDETLDARHQPAPVLAERGEHLRRRHALLLDDPRLEVVAGRGQAHEAEDGAVAFKGVQHPLKDGEVARPVAADGFHEGAPLFEERLHRRAVGGAARRAPASRGRRARRARGSPRR